MKRPMTWGIVGSALSLLSACGASDEGGGTPRDPDPGASAAGPVSSVQFALSTGALPSCTRSVDGAVWYVWSESKFFVCKAASASWVVVDLRGVSAAVRVTALDAGTTCTAGGSRVEFGLDANRNGSLDAGEVTSSQNVCNGTNGTNGANGANGTNGQNGTNGTDGQSTLIRTTELPTGSSECAAGGTLISVGLDANDNGSLDHDEVTTTSTVCNGPAGAQGASGPPGPSGAGHPTLTRSVPEAPGANCANGGSALQVGSDANDNGSLDDDEVTSTSYACNGAGLLSVTIPEHRGKNCPYAGQRTDSGQDMNATGTLEPNEVTSTSYACNEYHPSVALSGRGYHFCVLGEDGEVRCWTESWQVNHVDGLSNTIQVAPTYDGGCALSSDGTVRCWGGSSNYSEGSADLVPGFTNVTAITSGYYHVCALSDDGTVRCWGNGTPEPAVVDGLSGVTSVVGGYGHTCAVISDGSARCWGYNEFGQVGDGTTNWWVAAASEVVGLSGVLSVAPGAYHTCALLADHTVSCWGRNDRQQLGSAGFDSSLTPVPVPGVAGVVALTSGDYGTCALIDDGTVQCWGSVGYHTAPSAPETLPGISSATAVAAGSSTSCALVAEGSVQCWGNDPYPVSTLTLPPDP